MNVVRSFADYLVGIDVATLGQDLFISRAPSSNKVGDRIFWLKSGGGTTLSRAVNGSVMQQYIIEIYHRDVNTEGVHETLQGLGDDLSVPGFVTLEDYDLVKLAIDGPWIDQDLDKEERDVGLLRATLTVHKPTN